MPVFTLKVAAKNVAKLIARAEAGEDITLARSRQPVARIISVRVPARPQRQFARLKVIGRVGPEFFEPLPEEELSLWEGYGDASSVTPRKR